MGDIAIRVEGLSKLYRLGARERYRTLRDTLTDTLSAPARLFRRRNGNSNGEPPTLWALKDVSFEVKRGEVIGIIGRNGAGKSTLLKILSRITEPTEGRAIINGRLASLLEVGTGFHPELTGRENVYLNGAILGMKRAEIGRKFDEIVAFAEVEKFIDTPVKHYSSGMYVRLAFAVAAHLEPEILVVDEVLAVGDAGFQKKCLGKIGEVARAGRTVLFVSHNMAAVQKLCTQCALLDVGRLVLTGGTRAVIREYLGNQKATSGRLDPRGRTVVPDRVIIQEAWLERDGTQVGHLLFGDQVELVMAIKVLEATSISVELLLRQADGVPVAFIPSGLAHGLDIRACRGIIRVRATLPPARLAAGPYSIDLILAESNVRFLDYIESAVTFQIDSAAVGPRNWAFTQDRGQGHALWDVTFAVEGLDVAAQPTVPGLCDER